MTTNASIILIAAVARNGVIGQAGKLPWHLPGDLKKFRETTLGNPVILGRKTLESIGKPLSGRNVIMVTRNRDAKIPGIVTAHSPREAIATARDIARISGSKRIFVAGGAEIYAASIDIADMLDITHVDLEVEGDTMFPVIDPSIYDLTYSEDWKRENKNNVLYKRCIYDRIR